MTAVEPHPDDAVFDVERARRDTSRRTDRRRSMTLQILPLSDHEVRELNPFSRRKGRHSLATTDALADFVEMAAEALGDLERLKCLVAGFSVDSRDADDTVGRNDLPPCREYVGVAIFPSHILMGSAPYPLCAAPLTND